MSVPIQRVKKFEKFTFAYTVGENPPPHGELVEKPLILSKLPTGVVFRKYREYAAYHGQGLVREFQFIVEGSATSGIVGIEFNYIKEYNEGGVEKYEVTETHVAQVEILGDDK